MYYLEKKSFTFVPLIFYVLFVASTDYIIFDNFVSQLKTCEYFVNETYNSRVKTKSILNELWCN